MLRTKAIWCGLATLTVTLALGLSHAASQAQEPTKRATKPAASVPAPAAKAAPTADEKAIRAAAASFAQAFNAGDAKALAAHWRPDGDLVDDSGRSFQGRDAIEREYKAFFAEHPGATLEVEVDTIRTAGPNLAIEDGNARVRSEPNGPSTLGRYTAVHLKDGGKWLMTSVREARLARVSPHEHLKDLEWMVGDWQAKAGDAKIAVHCEWTEGKQFLRRTVQTSEGQQKGRSATQVIGWDPTRGCVRSWLFDSEGGFGEELWEREGSKWILEAAGVHPDGSESSATNILTIVDADHITWQSVARSLDDASLPDTAVVGISRVGAKEVKPRPASGADRVPPRN